MAPAPAALVLAAGEGRRMGGPKALLSVRGRPLVLQHLECLRAAGCAPVGVVTRPSVAPAVEAWVDPAPGAGVLRVVPAVTGAQAASLAVGLRALFSGRPGDLRTLRLVVTPVDLVPPAVETVRALLACLDAGAVAATPTFRGRGGHPVALRGELLAAFLSGPVDAAPSLRDVLRGAGARRVRLEVEDAAVVGDLDTPADVQAFGEEAPRFVSRGTP